MSKKRRCTKRSRPLLVILGAFYCAVYHIGRSRVRRYPGSALLEHLLRGIDSEVCPTLGDVLATPGSRSLRDKVWKDPMCTSGCVLSECKYLQVPCCVVRKAAGTFNEAMFVCTRQVDNSLLTKLYTANLVDIVHYCRRFLAMELQVPDCSNRRVIVPKTLHAIGHHEEPPNHVLAVLHTSPNYTLNYVSDQGGFEFIKSNCGEIAALAYECVKPPAFRADLFRFCALFSQGGVYMDTDILPLVSLDDLFSNCSSFTLGYDQAQKRLDTDHIGMQMKILAGKPNNHISKCMISEIVQHVRQRKQFTKDTLGFSGPQLLRKCYLKFPDDVAITYTDTRGADWPFCGLRAGARVLAYEIPSAQRHFDELVTRNEDLEYNDMVKKRDLYTQTCKLH